MKLHENLVALIQSLTADEKRCFTVLVGSDKKEQNYLQLFEALERDGHLSPRLFKLKYADAKWLNSYASAKNHLYKTILKSLLLQHQHKDQLLDLLTQIQHWRLLNLRSLFQQGFDTLKLSEKKAKEGDNVLMRLLIESFRFHSQHSYTPNLNKIDDYLNNIQNDLQKLVNLQTEFSFYIEQYTLQNILYTFISNLSNQLIEKIKPTLQFYYDKQLFYERNLPKNPSSLALYWFNWQRLHNLLDINDKSQNGFENSIAILEQNPLFLQHRNSFFNAIVISRILEKLRLNDLENIQFLFDKIQPKSIEIHEHNPIKTNQNFIYAIVLLDYYICLGDSAKIIDWRLNYKENILAEIAKQAVNNSIYAHYILGASYFMTDDFALTEKHWPNFATINAMPNEYDYQIKTLQLLILWKKQDWIVLDIHQNTFSRQLKKNGEYSPFYHNFFLFVRYAIKNPSKATKALQRWRNYLESQDAPSIFSQNNTFPHAVWAKNELGRV